MFLKPMCSYVTISWPLEDVPLIVTILDAMKFPENRLQP